MSGQYGAILFWLDSLFHLFYQSLKKTQLHSEQQVKQFSSFYLSLFFPCVFCVYNLMKRDRHSSVIDYHR